MSRGARLQRIFDLEGDWKTISIKPSGDCFFEAVFKACDEDSQTTIQNQRKIVANAMTQETFDTYKLYWESKVGGYEFMKKIDTLDDLKDKMMVCGKDVGAGRSIWADAFAIQTISDELNLIFVIVSTLSSSTHTQVIKPTSSKHNKDQPKALILELTRRDHYNLLAGPNGNALFTLKELPDSVFEAIHNSK